MLIFSPSFASLDLVRFPSRNNSLLDPVLASHSVSSSCTSELPLEYLVTIL